ncbi:MAG TPA: GGDEF domain-containing protein [Acidisarcina sp.]
MRTITTAYEAHNLPTKEAARAFPIHIQGVITYFDQYLDKEHVALFVHDATGSIYVSMLAQSVGNMAVGKLVDVRGVSGPGDFAPVVAEPTVTLIGDGALPPTAPFVGLRRLLTGLEDGQWVEVEGIVHSVFLTEHNIALQLVMAEGTVNAVSVRERGVDYTKLVDSKVRIRANAAPLFNGRRQMVGVHLLFPNMSTVEVTEAGPPDPFQLRTLAIDDVSRFDQLATLLHRIHIRGTVTLQWPGVSLCIRDATHALCAQTTQATPLNVGDIADVVGFASAGDSAPVLTDAIYRKAGTGEPMAALPVTAEQALLGQHDSELIQIDGQVIGRSLASTDTSIMVSSGKVIFAAVLSQIFDRSQADAWQNGSKVRILGICSVQLDVERSSRGGVAIPRSLRVLLRSPEDVLVLQKPSWWTPSHALVVLAVALTGTLGVLCWVVVLRKRVRESEEKFRHMAQHDALTGLATRRVLHDRLNVALERAARYSTGLAVLMLDLDRFKAINDTYGHHAGDETLRLTAQRITSVVRKSDTVARMGGDEFVVLLPDVENAEEAEKIAAKVVAALSVPVLLEGREIPVSVSVGICAAAGAVDADALLRNVDTALYRAKAGGRNCFETFRPDMDLAQTIAGSFLMVPGLAGRTM